MEERTVIRTRRIRLKPTPEQEVLFRKSAGVARWAYNFLISEKERVYKEYLDNGNSGKKSISEGEVRKYINNELKPTTHTWLKEVGSNVMKQGVKDADEAYKNFFAGRASKPRYKSKKRNKMAFYVNYESLIKTADGFRGERIGVVKTSEPLPDIPKGTKYSNPRISYDNKYWYLSVGYEVPIKELELTGEVIGIDLGVKDLAICSNGKVYKNINKTRRVKQLKKRLKRQQRRLSRKMRQNIASYGEKRKPNFKKPLDECQNYQKQKHKIQLTYRSLTNIRNNYLHQTTTEIVKAKPSRIVMETLNVTGMMKNRHLAKAIAEQKLFEFKRQVAYKATMYGIELIEVPTFYPSSKTCSVCGCIKSDLKLSDRTYHCEHCGNVMDRDLNAAINLANYGVI